MLALSSRPLTDQEVRLLFHILWVPHRHNRIFWQNIEEQRLLAGPALDEPRFLGGQGQHQQFQCGTCTSIACRDRSDALQFVIEEIEAVGNTALSRPDIEQSTTDGKISRASHLWEATVARLHQ